ncbi:hypothetical protein ACIQF5_35250 [Streptomyces goshikiensis]|uniref:hypothetical protein n=1 Tax=Streptomyces goshikiensis TaxID=1942 RepID=UPI003811B1B4
MGTSTAQEQDRLDPALVRLGAGRGPRRIGRLSGVITGPVSVAPILGPVVGGLIVQGAGWRRLFLVNVPVGLLALPAARIVPADGAERDTAVRPDVLGLMLLPTGLAALVYGLAQPGTGGLDPVRAVALAAGCALLAGYVAHAPRTTRTLLTGDPLPEALLIAALFLRGVGLGAVVPPGVAATYTRPRPAPVPS